MLFVLVMFQPRVASIIKQTACVQWFYLFKRKRKEVGSVLSLRLWSETRKVTLGGWVPWTGWGRECGGSQGPGWLSAAAGPREGLDGEGFVWAVMPLETDWRDVQGQEETLG